MYKIFFLTQIFLFIQYFNLTAQTSIASPGPGTLTNIVAFPSKHISARNIDIWVPDIPGYTGPYAVIYMQDGQKIFKNKQSEDGQEWGISETLSGLMKKNTIIPCMVVGIWNAGVYRVPEYFPQKAFENLPQQFKDLAKQFATARGLDGTGIQSDAYLKFLTEELKPYIDSLYPTAPDQKNTFIAGSSMGALLSIYAICEYPEVFGGAACLSTHWPGLFSHDNNPIPDAIFDYMKDNLPKAGKHKLYFDYGTESLDALYEPYQKQMDKILKAKGYTSDDWITKKFDGEGHNQMAWRKRLHIPMSFLLGG
jgi:predicted alpha/beta superfamily hydrolase